MPINDDLQAVADRLATVEVNGETLIATPYPPMDPAAGQAWLNIGEARYLTRAAYEFDCDVHIRVLSHSPENVHDVVGQLLSGPQTRGSIPNALNAPEFTVLSGDWSQSKIPGDRAVSFVDVTFTARGTGGP